MKEFKKKEHGKKATKAKAKLLWKTNHSFVYMHECACVFL